ncbi:glycosyltransferase family 1 protein [Rossellomorea aquimaris]|uniref:glycosyltransferase family 1 protein n=1 Tax=Rossellomorea aquimaris TaxID=189382 RepID=UPI0007D09CD4|nr:glycosyltransferase family 1 protein [Rossellomorea aquimaris]
MTSIQPKRILHVVGAMNRAGTETMLMNLYRNINHKEIQFDFISYNQEEAHYDEEIKSLGGRIIKLSNTQSVKELYLAIKKFGPYQAVHAHTLFHCGIATFAAWLAGVKIRVSHAHTTYDKSEKLIRKIYIKLMSYIIKSFSTHLLACSKEAGRYLYGKKGVLHSHYSYFPNVIDYSKFIDTPNRKINEFKVETGLGNSVVIGHIGRFIEAKNHDFLINILKCIVKKDASIKLLLVGDGDLKEHIEKRVEIEGIINNVRLVGIREDIETVLHSLDVFVFPSIYEGLGLVLLEAQATGIPCVVSEAIQPEADLQLNLVSTLYLKEGPNKWAEEILNKVGKREKNSKKIIESFEQRGFSPEVGKMKLLNIYQLKSGEEYEKSIDRFL